MIFGVAIFRKRVAPSECVNGQRDMPWLAKRSGLKVQRTFPYLLSEIGSAYFFVDALPSLKVLLPKVGVADEAQVNSWIEQQMRNSAEGTFFGSINFYTYLLAKTQQ